MPRSSLSPESADLAMAIGTMLSLGLSQREIGVRLGYSGAWVGEQLARLRAELEELASTASARALTEVEQ